MSYRTRRPPARDWSWLFSAKGLLRVIGVLGLIGAVIFWWGVQSQMTPNWLVAGALTLLLALASPALTAFFVPWSPAGMLLARINGKTWGQGAALAAALYLLYYAYTILYSWWAAQPVVAETGLTTQQVQICLILFVFIPALVWTPVTTEEMVSQIRQDHLVRRYELQVQADIAILRATLLRAQEKALKGFANLTVQERGELAGVMRGLVTGIGSTLQQIGQSVQQVSGAAVPFETLDDNDDIRSYLDYIAESLTENSLPAAPLPAPTAAPAAPAARTPDTSLREILTIAPPAVAEPPPATGTTIFERLRGRDG